MVHIAPSLLAADFTHLADEIERIRPFTSILHLDIMDGHFVPNISFGPGLIKQLRPLTTMYFDVHLMISHPEKYVTVFKDAGAQGITVHVETFLDEAHGHRVIDCIHHAGCEAGITLKPGTSLDALAPYLSRVERVLIMTVEPGFGGQSLMMDQVEKIRKIAQLKHLRQWQFDIQVDGGVTIETAPLCRAAGATTLVAGTSVFKATDYAEAIRQMGGAL